jgi:hypothetical protein
MFTEHHIIPKFDKGTNEAENRVLVHIHEHGLLHLLRWLWTKSPRDLGGFTSAIRTEDSILEQKQKRSERQPNSPLPPNTPVEKRQPTITARLVQQGRIVRTQYHKNNRVNANPFGWFVATMTVEFEHENGKTYIHQGSPNDIMADQNTARDIACQLNEIQNSSSFTKEPFVLSQVLTGVKKRRGGWGVKQVVVSEQSYSLMHLKELFECVQKAYLENKITNLNSQKLLNFAQIANAEISTVQAIVQFLEAHQTFLTSFSKS